ncbi:hypothetical protein PoB_004481100 [Plakobranchus ocellatus]|uniref:Uncharacterized protein n=1 Tax=Plakobranchus ocellatus TaxID=259542 RepID=A0AAV4BD25_9GAST|nr:hypothetical protein PoB_004481100 [Plakobranchus ocellatus]
MLGISRSARPRQGGGWCEKWVTCQPETMSMRYEEALMNKSELSVGSYLSPVCPSRSESMQKVDNLAMRRKAKVLCVYDRPRPLLEMISSFFAIVGFSTANISNARDHKITVVFWASQLTLSL